MTKKEETMDRSGSPSVGRIWLTFAAGQAEARRRRPFGARRRGGGIDRRSASGFDVLPDGAR